LESNPKLKQAKRSKMVKKRLSMRGLTTQTCCIHLLYVLATLDRTLTLFVEKVLVWSLFEDKQRNREGDGKEVSFWDLVNWIIH
jgi:hypothetical protein